MNASGLPRSLRAVILVGVVYLAAGLTFATLAAASTQMRTTWRLAAWVISLAAFAAHIWYEHAQLRSAPRTAALHVALAVALGAFGLAVAANVHAQAPANHQRVALALVLWPVVTALPAFVVALAAAALARTRPSA
jgi:hypothetical protein